MKAKNWQKIKEKVVKVGYKKITLKDFKMPDGQIAEFTTWGTPKHLAGSVIALTKDNKVIIARQFRPGPEQIFDELPGGMLEEGEDLIKAATRELREETGYEPAGEIEYVGSACRDAYTNMLNHYFIAYNCKKTANQKLDSHEHVEVVLISIEELFKNAKEVKMSDAVAVLLAYDKLKGLK